MFGEVNLNYSWLHMFFCKSSSLHTWYCYSAGGSGWALDWAVEWAWALYPGRELM